MTQSIKLEAGKSCQLNYLTNDSIWASNPESDEFIPNGFAPGQFNSKNVV